MSSDVTFNIGIVSDNSGVLGFTGSIPCIGGRIGSGGDASSSSKRSVVCRDSSHRILSLNAMLQSGAEELCFPGFAGIRSRNDKAPIEQ